MRRLAAALAALALCGAGSAAQAQGEVDLFGRDTVSGLLDVRLQAADGESSFLRGGYGKTQASGGGANLAVRPVLDLGALAWRPSLGQDVSAYILAQTQPGQDHAVDLAEAYLAWKPIPRSNLRVSARGGVFWPPFSLEHDGTAWSTTRTLTPSAINTWIAEEVKVAGLEASVSDEVAGHRLSATVAGFFDNDTSGTLLSFRGWALHDVRTTAFGTLPLPQFGTRVRFGQADEAQPSLDLDGRPGGYVKLEWRPPAPVVLEASYYDNAGNPHILKNGQWGWRTTFTDVGVTWRPADGWEVLAQGLTGRTYFGEHTPRGWYLDADFSSAYVLATRTTGRHRFTARADGFEVRDLSFKADDQDERGWAAAADYAFRLTPRLTLWAEALHVWSSRPGRADLGVLAGQSQTVVQVALRAEI